MIHKLKAGMLNCETGVNVSKFYFVKPGDSLPSVKRDPQTAETRFGRQDKTVNYCSLETGCFLLPVV